MSGGRGSGAGATSTAASPLDGVYYYSTVTRDQLRRSPAFEPGEGNRSNYGHFTLTIAHGRWRLAGSADGILTGGKVAVHGDRIALRPT